ncbi:MULTISPECIES: hypothetical protein [Mycobacterium]|nr:MULTISPECIES: hypothetical protein [Mycobacterium]MDM4140338.1 hypothetical protein [Mycobacterium sp. FLAC0960]
MGIGYDPRAAREFPYRRLDPSDITMSCDRALLKLTPVSLKTRKRL